MGRSRLSLVHSASLLPFLVAMIFTCTIATATDRIEGDNAASSQESTEVSGKNSPSAIPILGSVADGAMVRSTLQELIAKYEVIAAAWGSQRALDAYADARRTLDGVMDEDLAVLAPVLPNFIDCIQSADMLLEIVQSHATTPKSEPATDGLPDADYYEDFPCDLITETPQNMIGFQTAMQGIRLGRELAMLACNQVTLGFNGALVCTAVELVYQASLSAWEEYEFCADWHTAAEVSANYARLEHIHGDLEDVVDTLEDIHVDIDTLQETVDEFVEEFKKFAARDLRIKIEDNLAGHGVHPNALALFQLPATLGGYLDTARVIVVETIDNMRLAGENILNAETRLAQGDAEYQSGNYKRAYQRYSEAYAAAAKPIGADNQSDGSAFISKSDAAEIIAMLRYIFDYGNEIELPNVADLDGSGYISITDLTALIAKVRAESQNGFNDGGNPPDSSAVENVNSSERE